MRSAVQRLSPSLKSEVSREFVTSDTRIMLPTLRLQGTSLWCANGPTAWDLWVVRALCEREMLQRSGRRQGFGCLRGVKGWRRVEAASTHPVAHPACSQACVPDFFAPLKGQRRNLP
jgi:hypothetical protein